MHKSNAAVAASILAGVPAGMTAVEMREALAEHGRELTLQQVKSVLSGNLVQMGKAYRVYGVKPPRYAMFAGSTPTPETTPASRRRANLEWSLQLLHRIDALAADIADIREQAAHIRAPMDVCLGLDSLSRGAARLRRELGAGH